MIVLTYIKLHQSAMRDIVLLVKHAKKKVCVVGWGHQELHLNVDLLIKKFSCSGRGSCGAILRDVV